MRLRKKYTLFIISIFLLLFSSVCYYKRRGIKRVAKNTVYKTKLYISAQLDTNKRYSNEQQYDDVVTPEKRFLAIGFDDFRDSDFSLIIPLFKKYGANATFNRYPNDAVLSKIDLCKINKVLKNGNELGDHTWFHCNYIFTDALCNGQNPECIDGNQVPFPSNEQMRNDFGNNKNAFGLELESLVAIDGVNINKTWKELTDSECQLLRERFSIYCDKSGKLELFDNLSNKYLGTSGSSNGSWDSTICSTIITPSA